MVVTLTAWKHKSYWQLCNCRQRNCQKVEFLPKKFSKSMKYDWWLIGYISQRFLKEIQFFSIRFFWHVTYFFFCCCSPPLINNGYFVAGTWKTKTHLTIWHKNELWLSSFWPNREGYSLHFTYYLPFKKARLVVLVKKRHSKVDWKILPKTKGVVLMWRLREFHLDVAEKQGRDQQS